MSKPLSLLLCAALLSACATPLPYPAAPATSPPPFEVAESIDAHLEREVLWGGMILEVTPRERWTELEVLAFPLDRRQQPLPHLADEGRFILVVAGFADPLEYAPGRFVTVPGRITGLRRGTLRNEDHAWPMVDALSFRLWPREFRQNERRWSVGVGVSF